MYKYAKDIMTGDVFSVRPTMSVVDMDAELLKRGIGGAPVVEDGKLLGVVSRSDIARKLSGDISKDADYMWGSEGSLMSVLVGTNKSIKPAAESLRELCVRDIMTDNSVCVAPDDRVDAVAKLMVSKRIHRVLVAEEDKLVGIISSLDMVRIVYET